VIRHFLVVEMPDAGDQRVVALLLGPVDRLFLRLESFEHLIGAVFNDIVLDRASFRPPFWSRLNVNIGHGTLPNG
jgi:hypothetical protein